MARRIVPSNGETPAAPAQDIAEKVFVIDTYCGGERTLEGLMDLREFVKESSQQIHGLLRMALESTAPPEMTVGAMAAITDLAFQSQQAIEMLLESQKQS